MRPARTRALRAARQQGTSGRPWDTSAIDDELSSEEGHRDDNRVDRDEARNRDDRRVEPQLRAFESRPTWLFAEVPVGEHRLPPGHRSACDVPRNSAEIRLPCTPLDASGARAPAPFARRAARRRAT